MGVASAAGGVALTEGDVAVVMEVEEVADEGVESAAAEGAGPGVVGVSVGLSCDEGAGSGPGGVAGEDVGGASVDGGGVLSASSSWFICAVMSLGSAS